YSILSFLRGEGPRIQSAERAIDWVYVDDVVQGLIACGRAQGLEGTAVDIGSGELHTVREVVETIGVEVQASQSPVFGETAGHPERVRVADIQDARERAGWAPAIGLREGLRRTIAWYEDAVRDGALVGVQQT